MNDDFSGKVAVVTGASSGVGRATVRALAHAGANVGLIARGIDGLEAARREVEAAGARACVAPADVADAAAVERAAEAIERELGPIDIWINNAMTSVFAPFAEITDQEFERVTDVTYLGYVHGTRAALRRMRPRDRGAIVQVGSALAYRGIPLQSAYCGAKHAIQGFTESVRSELLHDHSNVHLTMVQLPALNTPQFDVVRSRLPKKAQPVPPIYEPEVAANAILWAAVHHRRELNVGSSTTLTIVGNNVAPWLGDAYLAKKGYRAQQTGQPDDHSRGDNLFQPLSGDPGAHGRFSGRAQRHSAQLWLSTHRFAAFGGAALGALAALAFSRRRA